MLYFNPDEIPEEKAMPKPVRRAVLTMLADIPIKRRKSICKKRLRILRRKILIKPRDKRKVRPNENNVARNRKIKRTNCGHVPEIENPVIKI